MRHTLAALLAVFVLGTPWFAFNYPTQFRYVTDAIVGAGEQIAAIILAHNPKSVADIQAKYVAGTISSQTKVRVLIVPGHEPDYGGAEYRSSFGYLKERDLTVELGEDLQQLLAQDPHYQVFIARDTHSWDPVFADYFGRGWDGIVAWERAHKQEVMNLISLGRYRVEAPPVYHNSVPDNVAMHLYGMGKWANENDIDIIIHVHFNDYPGHGAAPGKYSGFAIYVPEDQYDNSTTTHAVADSIFKRLAKYNPVSDFKPEKAGIVEDPDLIALGAYNSIDAASMLIEYSYLYEPQIGNPATHATFLKELAYETYLGLQDFFEPAKATQLANAYDTLWLPYHWDKAITDKNQSSADVYALQTALTFDGEYPPAGKGKNDCPRTGGFGPCTKAALEAFQNRFGITGEKGMVGAKTLDALNQQFGAKVI